MIMDVSDALDEWLQLVKLKVVTETTVDFVLSRNAVLFDIQAVVQPADLTDEQLKPEVIDWSREYLMFHSRVQLLNDNYIEVGGKDYRIVKLGRFGDYGYHVGIGEETKKPLLLPAPVNTVAPSIGGVFAVDELLTVDAGTWTGATSFTYAWRRDGVPIQGATALTYLLVDDDLGTTVNCLVTALNDFSYTAVVAPGGVVA